jgi:hypothetical protein
MEPTRPAGPAPDEQERLPIFGTWPRIYAAVIVSALVHMALIAVFSSWKY